jgi:hypothetical protein
VQGDLLLDGVKASRDAIQRLVREPGPETDNEADAERVNLAV